jgi:hypothetical protein
VDVHLASLANTLMNVGDPPKAENVYITCAIFTFRKCCTVESGLRRSYISCRAHRDSNEKRMNFGSEVKVSGRKGF